MGAIGGLLSQGFGLFGASSEADAARSQGAYQKAMYDINARFADLQADDALARGEKNANRARMVGAKVQGAQRAAYAGQGVTVDTGVSRAVQTDTALLSELDAQEVKSNAWREAFGFKNAANDARTQGALAKMAGDQRGKNTLLAGGLKALGSGLDMFGKAAAGAYPRSSDEENFSSYGGTYNETAYAR